MELGSNSTLEYDIEGSYTDFVYSGKPLWAEIGFFMIPALGVPGNILTLVVLSSNTMLRKKPINMFIMHQSLIDLIVCILSIAEELVIEFNINGQVLCHLLGTKVSSHMTLYASSYNMTALTLERHYAIIDPLHYDPEKVRKRLPYVFVFVWMFCIIALGVIPVSTVYENSTCFVATKLQGIYYYKKMSQKNVYNLL